MKSLTLNGAWRRSSAWARGLALASLATGVWALSLGTAHARDYGADDVYWSVGVNRPGVSVGVSNAPPPPVVVVQPRPVVVYQHPPQVRPVVVRQPVYYVYGHDHGTGWHKHKHRKHWKKQKHHAHRSDRWDDHRHDRRHDRDDDDDDHRRGHRH